MPSQLHGGETGGFHADGTGPGELQRGDVDLGEGRFWCTQRIGVRAVSYD